MRRWRIIAYVTRRGYNIIKKLAYKKNSLYILKTGKKAGEPPTIAIVAAIKI
jgi:hypothetical protein